MLSVCILCSALAAREVDAEAGVRLSSHESAVGCVIAVGDTTACQAQIECQTRTGCPEPDALIAVARDVAPEWAKTLEEARAKDPATFRIAAERMGKRLASLAVLRRHKPALYALRVEELRVQGQLEGLGAQWGSAQLGNRQAEAQQIESQIRALAGTIVDLNLRSRAMELAEIDTVMRTMRSGLEQDARARDETVSKIVDAYRDGREAPVLGVLLGGRSPVDSATPAATQPVVPSVPSVPSAP